MDDQPYWLALHRLPNLGVEGFSRLLAHYLSARAAWEARAEEVAAVAGPHGPRAEAIRLARRRVDPEAEYERLARRGLRLITWFSPDYPWLLRFMEGAPPVLYCRGAPAPADHRAVAIVGPRRADEYGLKAAYRLGRELAAAGVTIVSGLARGVDAAAHRGALAGGGRTLAVLGCGIDVVYPAEHRRLYDEVAAHGAILTEYPPGTSPDPEHFPLRNRIIAGLSRAVVIAQAGERSGALITAAFALDNGREVAAVPGDIFRANSIGANRLVRDGATPVLEAADVLPLLGGPFGGHTMAAPGGSPAGQTGPECQTSPDLTDIEERIYALMAYDPHRLEELAEAAGCSLGTTTAAVLLLEIKGLVKQVAGPYYVRAIP